MTKEQTPLSGYSIEHVFSTHAELKVKKPVAESRNDSLIFSWDWRLRDTDVFDVRLVVGSDPTEDRPYMARVDAIGRFKRSGPDVAIELEEFARLQAVAILMPYARQFLASLTQNTLSGPILLPALNVAKLMERMEPEKATGAKQLRERATPKAIAEARAESTS